MQFSGKEEVKASPEKVFDFITDPQNFAKGIPDIKKIDVLGPDKFKVTAKLGISFLRGTFVIDFTVKEVDRPKHASLHGHGTGVGSAVDLDIDMDLKEKDGYTIMNWKADAKIAGMLASLGQRMINSVAEKLVRQIFGNIKKNLEG